ncbi:MAG: methyltransferase domain-containing protein [Elusimicrobia bacterium]|nr:methyltransferase domain-containing protein [Elusimicrobiota bacterium]
MDPNNCRLCGRELFPDPLLQLDRMPKAAQYYPEKGEFGGDKGIALKVRQCAACGLVQLDAGPVDYFREVITAASVSGKARASRLAQMTQLVDRFGLRGRKVLDVGTGKGEMLDVIAEAGAAAVGLEAAAASVAAGRAAGRNMVQGYIGDAGKIEGAPFDAFISLNYLEHLPDPGAVIRRIYDSTAPGAAGFVTVPNLDYLLKTRSFYEFVADHLSYFTRKTLTCAFEANGFDVLDCGLINNDNDIAVTVKKKERLDISAQYAEVEALIRSFRKILDDRKAQNKKMAVWGAGHRTLALLALTGAAEIEYIIDSAKFKHGKFSPIMHTKIMPPEHLLENRVDLVFVMVPGIYPEEVCATLDKMNLGVEKAILRDNKIVFI